MGQKRDYVHMFFGSDLFGFENTDERASKWFYIKPQVGNLCPAVYRPYSALSAVPYSGCYPTGYGVYRASSSSVPKREIKCKRIKGFTHYNVSGTGYIERFYNFYMVSFLGGDRKPKYEKLLEESAEPGRYTAVTEHYTASATVTRNTAVYTVSFRNDKCNRVVLQPAYGGLDLARPATEYAQLVDVCLEGKTLATRAQYAGIELFAYTRLDAFEKVYQTEIDSQPVVVARLPEGVREVELTVAFSFTAAANAERYYNNESQPFASAALDAANAWDTALNIVDCDGGEREKRLLYTCLYNAQKKPVDISHENFFNNADTMYTEIATMWDMYKTALPFLALFYPDRYRDLINGLLSLAEDQGGRFSVCVLLEKRLDRNAVQARSLAHNLIMTAYNYKIDGIDYRRALGLMVLDLERTDLKDTRNTHLLDLADACWFTASLAGALGELGIYERFTQRAKLWREAFDDKEGLLKHGEGYPYYEGTHWNYSFRLSPYIKDRIALCGTERFEALLDKFFGYTRTPVHQYRKPTPDHILAKYAETHPSFEGLNNEPDMETPYNYTFINRHDRVCEIVTSAMRACFDDNAGGLPGNDDSGALSSWYVFNAVGLFPMAGTDIFFIGSPRMPRSVLRLKNEFVVTVRGMSDEAIYVEKAVLNGKDLDRLHLFHSELVAGGELELTMTARADRCLRAQTEVTV